MILATACDGADDASILLFNGTGASPNGVRAIEAILRERGLSYQTADSHALDALDASQLRAYRLLIVPGGNFVSMGQGLKPATSARIRDSVQGGLNYLGICAGAFLAGDSPYNGLDLTNGVRFRFYSASARGIRKSAVRISTPDRATLDHYWEDGPELSGWGTVVAKYPDGTPAIAQGAVGKGWVVLAGIHAEAPEDWRKGLKFDTPARDDNAYAARLIQSALDAAPLPGY